jgi:hypothetical protein
LAGKKLTVTFTLLRAVREGGGVLLSEIERVRESAGGWAGQADAVAAVVDAHLSLDGPLAKAYISYANAYETGNEAVVALREESGVGKALSEAETEAGVTLPSLLIQPVQRFMRYVLLLTDLQKALGSSSSPSVSAALATASALAAAVNDAVAESQGYMEKLETLLEESAGGGAGQRLVAPNRRLEHHGIVATDVVVRDPCPSPVPFARAQTQDEVATAVVSSTPAARKGARRFLFFLFSDVFAFAKPASKLSSSKFVLDSGDPVPLDCVWVRESPSLADVPEGPGRALSWELLTPTHRWVVRSPNAAEREGWLRALADRREARRRVADLHFGAGGTYGGDMCLGKREGRGRLVNLAGVYEGRWEGDVLVEGTWTSAVDGSVYVGPFGPCLLPHGNHGLLTWPSGDKYEGAFVTGKRCGSGTFTWSNGDVYKGGWERDLAQGRGTLFLAGTEDGRRVGYHGEWSCGQPHGQGILYVQGGKKYTGSFVRGVREGQGRMEYGQGRVYEGAWQGGLRHGQGVLTGTGGRGRYEGEWVLGRRQGAGRQAYTNGDRYDGSWRGGLRHGNGTHVFALGSVRSFSGEWANDVPLTGEVSARSGRRYRGPVSPTCQPTGRPDGTGGGSEWRAEDGTVVAAVGRLDDAGGTPRLGAKVSLLLAGDAEPTHGTIVAPLLAATTSGAHLPFLSPAPVTTIYPLDDDE